MIITRCFSLPFRISRTVGQTFKRNVSALYITGDKAKENFAVLIPYFDFQQKLKDPDALHHNITHRQMPIDLQQIYQLWDMYQDVIGKKKYLEKRRSDIANEIKAINAGTDENLKRKYRIDAIRAREDLKMLKENMYPLESKFINEYLDLPNDIHKMTPLDGSNIQPIFCHLTPKSVENDAIESHLSYTQFIEYTNPNNYYLLDDAAKLDLYLPFHILNEFTANGFVHFSNPDFLKTVAVEAAGISPTNQYKIVDDSPENSLNMLHVVGNGSMLSYLGYIGKLSIYKTHLPLRLITCGKEYAIPQSTTDSPGLYSASQSTVVQLFCATDTEAGAQDQFDEILQKMNELYQQFDEHFRVVYAPAAKLKSAESLRADFEMYSPFLKRYVCIGTLSNCSDYISKRLLFNYRDENNAIQFPHLITGTVVNATKLLAVLLECNKKVPLLFDSCK